MLEEGRFSEGWFDAKYVFRVIGVHSGKALFEDWWRGEVETRMERELDFRIIEDGPEKVFLLSDSAYDRLGARKETDLRRYYLDRASARLHEVQRPTHAYAGGSPLDHGRYPEE